MGIQRKGTRLHGRLVSEINVTPFVDVMLVLLIIFMVAAPLMIQGIDVHLPSVTAPTIPPETDRIVMSITSDGKVHVNGQEVDMTMLVERLSTIQRSSMEKRGVILRADRKVEYGLVAQVMGAIRDAGIEQIAMITEPVVSGSNHPKARESSGVGEDRPGSFYEPRGQCNIPEQVREP